MTEIVLHRRVQSLEKKTQLVGVYKTGNRVDGKDETREERKDLGWFLRLEGSLESNFVGDDKPEGFQDGDEVDIIIRKRHK